LTGKKKYGNEPILAEIPEYSSCINIFGDFVER
jgi:hypothetical protein